MIDAYLLTILTSTTPCFGQFSEIDVECGGCVLATACQFSIKNRQSADTISHLQNTISTLLEPSVDEVYAVIEQCLRTNTGRFSTSLPKLWPVPLTVDISMSADWRLFSDHTRGIGSDHTRGIGMIHHPYKNK